MGQRAQDQVPLAVATSAPCSTCHGTGARPGTTPSVCPRCQGRGIESQGQGLFSISQPCSRCGGSGTVIEDPCPTCHGDGAVRTIKKYKVNIPAGVRDGSRVRLAGKGEPGRHDGPPGCQRLHHFQGGKIEAVLDDVRSHGQIHGGKVAWDFGVGNAPGKDHAPIKFFQRYARPQIRHPRALANHQQYGVKTAC